MGNIWSREKKNIRKANRNEISIWWWNLLKKEGSKYKEWKNFC